MSDKKLTRENYHSREMAQAYMSYSQIKDFEKCEVMALAKIRGEYVPPKTSSLLFGSWVDAHFNGPEYEAKFIEENKDKLYSPKTGKLYADFVGVQKVIDFIENYTNEDGEKILLKYMGGDRQVIMTGFIAGVPFKIMMDSYFKGKCITDGKVMKDLEKVWVERNGRNVLVNFIEAYGYIIEGAVFQEIEYQNAKKENPDATKLPFVLEPVTKEEIPNAELILVDQDILDEVLEKIKEEVPRYQRIKLGLEKPVGCGKCPVCLSKKQIFAPQSYKKLYLEEKEEE